MGTQRQDRTGKESLSGASKRSDAFWSLIVPSARLKKGRPDPTTGVYAAHTQIRHAEELKGTQPVVFEETGRPHVIPRANATDLYRHHGVTPRDTKPVECRVKGILEPSRRDKPVDHYASIDEDHKRTQAQPVILRENGRPELTTRAQSAHPYISLAEQLDRAQRVEHDKYAEDGGLSEGEVFVSSPALNKGDKDEESSEGHDNTEGSDADGEYVEDEDKDDSETASRASSPAPRTSQLSYGKPRKASVRLRGSPGKWLKASSEATAPKRKTAPSQLASAKGRKPRKRVKWVVGESDKEEDEEENEEEDAEDEEEEAINRSVPHHVNRPVKIHAPRHKLSNKPALPPLSRRQQPWTLKEEETLFNLRNRGESWEYIGERVLGRTASAVQGHWDYLRTESLKPVETRANGRRRRQKSSVVSLMAKIPNKNTWSKEQEGTLISLRAQGRSLKYICRRIRGKSYGAVKTHWRMIKNKYPQAVTAYKSIESDGKGDPLVPPETHFPSASQHDREAKEADWDSRSAIVEGEDPKSGSHSDLIIDDDVNTPSAKQPYQGAVAFHVGLVSAIAGKSPKSKATSTDYRNQQASKPLTVREDASPTTNTSAYPDQPDSQPVIARSDPKTKKEWSYGEDLMACIFAQGTQKLGTHRRSLSWPQGRRVRGAL
ncbi:MAG: hypothetical protein Q9175_006279 [Cornicularia normoerica]